MSYYADDTVTVHHGDCLHVLATLPDASVEAVVTDPPYGLEFMGKEWDDFTGDNRQPFRGEIQTPDNPYGRSPVRFSGSATYGGKHQAAMRQFGAWCELWATECLRVLKPGGHLLAFGGTRTSHRLACAIEDAGFEIRDSLAWLHGQGFPKSRDVSKDIDAMAGAEREVIGPNRYDARRSGTDLGVMNDDGWTPGPRVDTAPATAAARIWQGWGTALKPAHEPVVVARKPLVGTVAQTVLAHGTGALNVDGCRVGDGADKGVWPITERRHNDVAYTLQPTETDRTAGRWPANVVLDESQAAALDRQSGESASRAGGYTGTHFSAGEPGAPTPDRERGGHDDQGGASRFFYTAKADAAERVRLPRAGASSRIYQGIADPRCTKCGKQKVNVPGPFCVCPQPGFQPDPSKLDTVSHPTVKPLALMRWLVRLVTPPGGLVLEPFAGSGTTVEACILEGFRCVAIEREADYLPLIVQRIHRRRDPVAAVLATGEDGGLFDLLGEKPA